MSNYRCEKCSYTNWINDPIDVNGRPLQDWFCKKCSSKLFSISYVKPSHSDAKPIKCQSCAATTKIVCSTNEIGNSAKWNCPKCTALLLNLAVRKETTDHSYTASTQNTVHNSKSSSKKNDRFSQFLRSNWLIVGFALIGLFLWINSSGSGNSNSSTTSASYNSANQTKQNVYRGTKIAEQEFKKYSRSERLRIQTFFKDNFGYRSSIDGLWGQQTANSFIRAANRYANGKSLYNTKNVNIVFSTALNKQRSTPRINNTIRPNNTHQNNLGLTNDQAKTFNYLNNLCFSAAFGGSGPDALARCSRNAFCQAKFGRNCESQRPQVNCYIVEHPLKGTSMINFPDKIVCE